VTNAIKDVRAPRTIYHIYLRKHNEDVSQEMTMFFNLVEGDFQSMRGWATFVCASKMIVDASLW
jgi:hypothetical protein